MLEKLQLPIMRLSNSVDDYLKKYGGYLVNDNVKNGMDIEVK